MSSFRTSAVIGQAPGVAPTVRALRALRPSRSRSGQVAYLLGYHAPGDGGGGTVFWDLEYDGPDDGGTTFRAGRGCWRRLESGPLNVRWFGARGDGQADDTAAIQKTFDVAAAVHKEGPFTYPARHLGGARVYFPAGIYRIRSEGDVPALRLRQNVLIRGDGPSSVLLYSGSATAVLWQPDRDQRGVPSGINGIIEDLRLTTDTPAAKIAISAQSVWRGTIRGVWIAGSHHDGVNRLFGFDIGVLVGNEGGTNNCSLKLSETSIGGIRGDGVRIAGGQASNIVIESCILQACGGWGVNSTVPYATKPGVEGSWAHVAIRDCDIEGNLFGGVTGNFWNSEISSCHFEYTDPLRFAPLYFAGDQALKGIRIVGNGFFNSCKVERAGDPRGYSIFLGTAGPIAGEICGNQFHGAPRAPLWVGREATQLQVHSNHYLGALAEGPFAASIGRHH